MTTRSIRFDFVPDVSARNKVLSLALSPSLKLAAGVWTGAVADSLATAQLRCLQHSVDRLKATRPDWVLWLVAAHKAVQPDNRVTRHYGLWKSLIGAGAELPKGEFVDESMLAANGGIRGYGAVCFELDQLGAVYSVMLRAQAAIAFTTRPAALTKATTLVERGWATMNTKPPEEIVELVCDQSGLLIDVFGEFDDREVSVAAIGRREVLIELSS